MLNKDRVALRAVIATLTALVDGMVVPAAPAVATKRRPIGSVRITADGRRMRLKRRTLKTRRRKTKVVK